MKRRNSTTLGITGLALCAVILMLGLAPVAEAQQDGDLVLDKARVNMAAEPILNQGDVVRYRIRYRNDGVAVGFMDALVEDDFDDTILENVEWVCVPSTNPNNCPGAPTNMGTGDISAQILLLAGDSCICQVRALIRECAGGILENTATITANMGDTDPDTSNNSQTISEEVVVTANVGVLKDDGETVVERGDLLTYQIDVTNNGTDCNPGLTLVDDFPSSLINVNWTCTGAACPNPAGMGDIAESFTLLPGDSVMYTAEAQVDPGTAASSITNTAFVVQAVANADDNPANDTASDTDTIEGAVVPTLPEVALVGLALALLLVGARGLRRRTV